MAYKGKFSPKNPHKYKGDPTNIVYRSLWELKFFRYCDLHPDFVEWSSEEMSIPYLSPEPVKLKPGEVSRPKYRRYFPDLIVKRKAKDGSINTFMIEIKPHGQTLQPDPSKKGATTKTGKASRRFLTEMMTYEVNQAKWRAARAFCHSKGWHFLVMTEYELGIKKR